MTTSSFKPILRTVSIMPGMENLAPERQETSNGLAGSPKVLAVSFSICRSDVRVCSHMPAGNCSPAARCIASLGADDEAGWYRQTKAGHFGQVGALAAQQVAHLAVALREQVDPLLRCFLAGGALGSSGLLMTVAIMATVPVAAVDFSAGGNRVR